jgi:hypothetical protein
MRYAVALASLSCALVACQPKERDQPPEIRAGREAAIDGAMVDGRRAMKEHGPTEAGMREIQRALARLAALPGIEDRARLGKLHGSATMQAGMLASDGDDQISIYVVHFAANTKTPVHDHLTWGVLHVLEGRDVYVPWQRLDAAGDPHRAELRRKDALVLHPGQSVYWLPPPHDIHSQETGERDVWELVMTGKNVLAEGVTRHRHYYDAETGRITGSAER